MSIALPDRLAPKRRLWTPRLVATLALFALSAAFFCAIASFVLVRQADDHLLQAKREGRDRVVVGDPACA